MVDYSFLRLKDNIADAKNIGDSPIVTHHFLNSIQLIPTRSYTQITNLENGISLTSDAEVFIVDCNNKVLADITENTFIEEFIDTNGSNQCKIEFVNLGVDFYKETVLPNTCRKRISVEAGVTEYWSKYIGLDGLSLGVDTFGESAPANEVYKYFGLTEENLIKTVNELIK